MIDVASFIFGMITGMLVSIGAIIISVCTNIYLRKDR